MKRHHYRFSAIEMSGKHSSVKIPDKWRFNPRDMEAYLDEHLDLDIVKLMQKPSFKPAYN